MEITHGIGGLGGGIVTFILYNFFFDVSISLVIGCITGFFIFVSFHFNKKKEMVDFLSNCFSSCGRTGDTTLYSWNGRISKLRDHIWPCGSYSHIYKRQILRSFILLHSIFCHPPYNVCC